MLGLTRGTSTLVGVAAAGFLVWLASTFELAETGGFWAGMALVAGAGLVLGLSQLLGGWTKWGRPRVSPGVFVAAFLPTLVAVGWILLATQPEGGWQQERLESWSDSIGILGFVEDIGLLPAALALAFGIVLAFTLDTSGPKERVVERDIIGTRPADELEDVGATDRIEVGQSTERTPARHP